MQKKSPLKDKALRNPGQKLDEQIEEFLRDKIFLYLIVIAMVFIFTVIEFYRFYVNVPYSPITYVSFCFVIIPYCIFQIYKNFKVIKNLELGRDGERHVAEIIDELKRGGDVIIHDIQGQGFNIDHVIVSKKGIFSIETKTLRKPMKGQTKIIFDGKSVFVNGIKLKRNPITQVVASSKWLQQELKKSSGKFIDIKPVIVFPEWFVESSVNYKTCKTWVMNPKYFVKYISNCDNILKEDDVMLFYYHLSRYVKTYKN